MRNRSFSQDEVRLFYLWLAGETPVNKGDDKRLIFICCPAERENLLRDFTIAFHAEHRFFLLRRAVLNK